jgi:hypothetical protein
LEGTHWTTNDWQGQTTDGKEEEEGERSTQETETHKRKMLFLSDFMNVSSADLTS